MNVILQAVAGKVGSHDLKAANHSERRTFITNAARGCQMLARHPAEPLLAVKGQVGTDPESVLANGKLSRQRASYSSIPAGEKLSVGYSWALYAQNSWPHIRGAIRCVFYVQLFEQPMPVDLHYICKLGDNYHYLGDDMFETGNWVATDLLSSSAVGGRIFLHKAQKEPAWHGGTIISYRSAPSPEEDRMVFVCRREFDYKVRCPVPWGWGKGCSPMERRSINTNVRARLSGNDKTETI